METDLYWRAVVKRDSRFDGAFVFAVKTTGIFCRPSCHSRLAKRENVQFFERADEARLSGFRACLRCAPDQIDRVHPGVAAVLKAIRSINAEPDISLDEISREVGSSAFHFQRTFKEVIGVSPKKYAEAKRMEKFKEALRAGSDIAGAMFDAGFGSSSRLYEKAPAQLGMTPAAYKKGGKGMKINFVITECELGRMLVARTDRGICSVTFGDDEVSLTEGLRAEFPNAAISANDEDLRNAVDGLLRYLDRRAKKVVLPLDLQATSFQMRVWDLLRKIPYGETRSYSEVAEALGDIKKVRAVARACASNRVAVVIPCHRVIASSGNLSGYRWGLERKKWLLEAESPK